MNFKSEADAKEQIENMIAASTVKTESRHEYMAETITEAVSN